jgi:MerR family transcriptional regulator, light-induced transcriptional regulator
MNERERASARDAAAAEMAGPAELAEAGEAVEPRHPIGVVADRTGVSVHVLRAWERRYAVVLPHRTEGGRRLYTDLDVQRLRLLRVLTEAGRSIGQVAHLSTAALRRLALEDEAERADAVRGAATGPVLVREPGPAESTSLTDPAVRAAAEDAVKSALAASDAMDAARLNGVLTRAVVTLRPAEFIEGVAAPLLNAVGAAWAVGRLHPAEEHLISAVLRRVLGWLLETFDTPADAPLLLVSTPAGERHEFGALLAAAVAADEGWRVVYLGADLPGAEIARAAKRIGASIVALSVVYGGATELGAELGALRNALGPRVPIYVGGAAAGAHTGVIAAAGARVQPDLRAWRGVLQATRVEADR